MENGSKKVGLRVAAGFLVAITIIVAVFASGITLPNMEVRTGRLTVLLTDAPVTLYSLQVTITGLEVHKVVDEDGMWMTLIDEDSDPPVEFNLLDYQDGLYLNLVSVDIDPGTFNKIRMNVSEAKAFYTEDDFNSDTGVELTVPPGKIDVITKFDLPEDQEVTVTIDMEPDWAAISNNENPNFRPRLKADIDIDLIEP